MGIFPNNVKINEKAQTANFSDLTKQCQELNAENAESNKNKGN